MKSTRAYLKIYGKILLITGGIQLLGCRVIPRFLAQHAGAIAPVMVALISGISLILSVGLGIFLPLRWCDSTKSRIIMILALPTNFMPLILLVGLKFILALLGEAIEVFSQTMG